MKVVVRLSKENIAITQLLKQGHGLTGPINNWGNINGAALYYGTAYAGAPGWIDFVQSGTSRPVRNLRNRGAVGLLFIPVQRRYLIYTFGQTIKKLSATGFERDFGLKVVLNTVNSKKLKSIDSKIVDTVVVNKRTQLNKENSIDDFGFEINKDLLRGVTGRPDDGNFATLVSGSDTLSISCDLTAATIRTKSRAILAAYHSIRYRRNYKWVDNIKPIKDQTNVASLNTQLVNEINSILGGAVNTTFQLASPDIIDFQHVNHFKFRGYRSTSSFDLPEFDDLINDLLNKGVTSLTTTNLMHYHVDSIDGNGQAIQGDSLFHWLISEIRIASDTYILSEGEWFKVGRSYFNQVQQTFTTIINSRIKYAKIGTTTYANEADYLTNYTVSTQEKILDKALSYTYGPQNSIEICDIYNSQGQLIHVKDGGSSSKLSHLFNQGYVSAITFISEPRFRQDIRHKLRTKPPLQVTITNPIVPNNYTVIFRILKKGPVFDLPFFTKVVIDEVHRKIINLCFRFKLEWVEKI